jgi:hypothetical protein
LPLGKQIQEVVVNLVIFTMNDKTPTITVEEMEELKKAKVLILPKLMALVFLSMVLPRYK